MVRNKYSETQINEILAESARGATTAELCERHGMSEQTFYRWKKKYGDGNAGSNRRLRKLEAENTRLKKLLADKELDIHALRLALGHKLSARSR